MGCIKVSDRCILKLGMPFDTGLPSGGNAPIWSDQVAAFQESLWYYYWRESSRLHDSDIAEMHCITRYAYGH